MIFKAKHAVSLAIVAVFLAVGIQFSSAADQQQQKGTWTKHHPRQAQVLNRDKRERRRVNKLFQEGKITAQQRDQMLAQLKDIRQENRTDAKGNDGGITKGEQKAMNNQENQVNKEMKQDAKTGQ